MADNNLTPQKQGHRDAASAPFSFFKKPVRNTIPTKATTLLEVYQLIKGESYKAHTLALRDLPQKQAKEYKATHFDYICPSGTFSSRKNEALIQHSGLMVIDLDHITGVEALKRALLADPYFDIELLFISPLGEGLKLFVSIDLDKGTHLDWFTAISNYMLETYQLKVDPSGKDVARACFLPHDPWVYIHPDYLTDSLSTSNTK